MASGDFSAGFKTKAPLFVSDFSETERRHDMTLYEWIRECLRWEAAQTAPESQIIIQRVRMAMEVWKQRKK